ncbi:hypothetical protein O181_051677 [Austropuccinia psidii MF-1]|uniref:Uncharacterized protein n=1 Tax=Austropuccinia psidii MF-1 TaxID=1389203 RepID=A0A9Q3HPS9_9BASI|nr:hypothetical protein [Austropuccinia psidii MF-1]
MLMLMQIFASAPQPHHLQLTRHVLLHHPIIFSIYHPYIHTMAVHFANLPSLRFCTPASFSPQLTILTLPHHPLMFSIYHPYAQTMIGFCTNSQSFAQLTIFPLMHRLASAPLPDHLCNLPPLHYCTPASLSLQHTILMLPHHPLIFSIYHPHSHTMIGICTNG